MKTNKKLIGSAASKDALRELIKKMWHWDDSAIENVIAGNDPELRIIQKGNRWRFERVEQ